MNTNKPDTPGWATTLLRGLPLLLVLVITLSITLNHDRIEELSALGYLGAFLIMLLSNATLILPAPGLIFVFALGSSLNPILLGIAAGLGGTLGEMTGYVTGYSGVAAVEDHRFAHHVSEWMRRNGTLTIFLLSLFPNPIFDLAGLMAGAGRMPVWRFLSVAFCGKLLQSATIALAGALSLSWVENLLAH
jgi:membrane protein YqaA with SNARE-associated domain